MKEAETRETAHDRQESEDIVDFSSYSEATRIYTYRPYSYWRIKRILNDYYEADLIPILGAYKANRVKGYKKRYKVVSIHSDEIITESTTLDTLRKAFAQSEIPLYDEKSKGGVVC